ncbi:TetR/AcrR family transcriptional regulator [Gottschalkiaceae bacterium SANA]|nr:TetR/AcrR family transcriptional regulator [Gottschalkiaceae bacterium SANA]
MNQEEKNKMSRKRILQASLTEFGSQDYASVTINQLCKKHHLSKGLLFHYYRNKDELFLLCVQKLFLDLSHYLEKNFEPQSASMESNLQAYIQKRSAFFGENQLYARIFYTVIFNPPTHLIPQIHKMRAPIIETNRKFWQHILSELDLKSNVNQEEAIDLIMNLEDFIHMRFQKEYIDLTNQTADHINQYADEYINLFNMLFYGIVE